MVQANPELNERSFFDIEVGAHSGKIEGVDASLINIPTMSAGQQIIVSRGPTKESESRFWKDLILQ